MPQPYHLRLFSVALALTAVAATGSCGSDAADGRDGAQSANSGAQSQDSAPTAASGQTVSLEEGCNEDLSQYFAQYLALKVPGGAPYEVLDGEMSTNADMCTYYVDDANGRHGSIAYRTPEAPATPYRQLPPDQRIKVAGQYCLHWSMMNGAMTTMNAAELECEFGGGVKEIAFWMPYADIPDAIAEQMMLEWFERFWTR